MWLSGSAPPYLGYIRSVEWMKQAALLTVEYIGLYAYIDQRATWYQSSMTHENNKQLWRTHIYKLERAHTTKTRANVRVPVDATMTHDWEFDPFLHFIVVGIHSKFLAQVLGVETPALPQQVSSFYYQRLSI